MLDQRMRFFVGDGDRGAVGLEADEKIVVTGIYLHDFGPGPYCCIVGLREEKVGLLSLDHNLSG